VDAAEVVERAQADLVLRLVAPALGAKRDASPTERTDPRTLPYAARPIGAARVRNPATRLAGRSGTCPALRAPVTAPRRIVPGTTYLVTRRCSERRFFLRPSALTNAMFLFVLALAARIYGIQVHAYCVLSNHYHLLLTDPEARLPEFMRYLDGLVARAVNCALGRWEGFWSSDHSYSAVEPVAPEDVVSKTAYLIANPVAAGLVRTAAEWPGLVSLPSALGVAKLVAPRPTVFFRADGDTPASATLELTPPPGFTADEYRRQVAAVVNATEEGKRRELGVDGFLGAARVRKQNPSAHPAPGEPRRELSPRVAGRDKWKRIEALSRLVTFLRDYRAAWNDRRAGVLAVIFPAGTYQLRVEHQVLCAPA
jgi:putative transposase